MEALDVVSLGAVVDAVWQYIATPLASAPWGQWRNFWLQQIFDDRFVIVYFLPLVPVLLLVPRARLRLGIILTGLVFLAYVFGVLYAGIWLLTCLALYWFSERFARECQRTDVLPIGPPLVAWLIIGGWYLATMTIHAVPLPVELNVWLLVHVPWIYPLGARGLPWEPSFRALHKLLAPDEPAQLFQALFWNVHSIGTAYLAVRMLHYLAEIRRGTLPPQRRSVLNFLAYTCYAPALIQGPIERFGPFQDEMDTCHLRRGLPSVPPALARIGWGITKSLIGTLYFQPLVLGQLGLAVENTYYRHPEQIESFWLLYCGVFLQIFWLYIEFSGYCDVSAGVARLLGYRQVENFYWPWLATSMRDFWRRWHISLSAILRDYVYIPLGGNRRHATLNLLITFTVCGIWHKLIPQVALWGLVMGLMVAINQHWAQWMKRLDERPSGTLPALRRAIVKLRPLPTIASWLFTQHAFVFSLLIFFGGLGGYNVAREICRRIWAWLV